MFVAFEGIDGSGKSTQARMLYEHMSRKEKVVVTQEPTDGEVGQLLRRCLKGEVRVSDRTIQLLFVADRSEHVKGILLETSKGISVISDRYVLSTIAYGMAAGLDKKWLIELNKEFPVPDHTVIINVDAKEAMGRIEERMSEKGREKAGKVRAELFEKMEFLEKVGKAYTDIVDLYPNTHMINSEDGVEETFDRVLAAIKE